MNTDNLGVSGSGVGGSIDPYSHHHLTQHHHLLPPHHSQHPSSMYCSSSNPYTEFFSPFPTDFVTAHDTGTNPGLPTDYLTLQNSLEYVVSHHHHHQQQQQHHHHHQIASSSNGERTSSSVGTGINGSDSSPSHSFGTSSGYSSSVDYYNTPVLTSKANVNNINISNTNASNNNNTSTMIEDEEHVDNNRLLAPKVAKKRKRRDVMKKRREWDELVDDARLLKKFKRGRLSKAEIAQSFAD